MARAIVLVLDSFGIGACEDAGRFGDAGANTYLHIKQACQQGLCDTERKGKLRVPNLIRLGLDSAAQLSQQVLRQGTTPANVKASWGYAKELSTGKDTSSGHWEMMGQPVLFEWGYFKQAKQSFPQTLLDSLVNEAQLPGILGNCHASGTQIIQAFGEEHVATGKPICYTSADSVFQIACHQDVFNEDALHNLCDIARRILTPYNIARVIARPFTGDTEKGFTRTQGRRDYSMEPHGVTLLDHIKRAGGQVTSVGKIADIFANKGISEQINAYGMHDLMQKTMQAIKQSQQQHQGDHLIFTNLVDFDTLYGHRRDVNGYALALEQFDQLLGELLAILHPDDLLIITADHGCDPTWAGSDHTREHIPVLVYAENIEPVCLGKRNSFADIGQSLASFFALPGLAFGESFLTE